MAASEGDGSNSIFVLQFSSCQAQIIHNAEDTMCYILITFPTVGILLYADECPSNAVLASKLYTTNCLA